MKDSKTNLDENIQDTTQDTEQILGNTLDNDTQEEKPTFNPSSLSFWVGLIAIILGTFEAFLIAFNVQLEINLLVEGVSTILFAFVCFGVLKTNNKVITKDDIKSSLEENLKSKNKDKNEE